MKIPVFVVVLMMASGFSCGNGAAGPPPTDRGDRFFRTTDPSRLYFKNIRSTAYEMKEQANTRVEIYQLRKYDVPADRPLLIPVIANNWLQDEAYLLLRRNEYEAGFADTLRIFWESPDSSGYFELAAAGFAEQYAFARRLADAFQEDHELRVLTQAMDTVPVFDNFSDRSNFNTTLRDFEKLIEQR